MPVLSPNNLKLVRALYANFCRFTRSELARNVPFRLHLDKYGKKVLVSSGSELMKEIKSLFKEPIIENIEIYNNYIKDTNKHVDSSSASSRIDVALGAVKRMNELKTELEERQKAHDLNKAMGTAYPSLCKFKVGQVVEHIEHAVRGVVIGWKIKNKTIDNCKESTISPTDYVDFDDSNYHDNNVGGADEEQIVQVLCVHAVATRQI